MSDPEERTSAERRAVLDARDWIVRLTSGEVAPETVSKFRAWYDADQDHRLAFARERSFWHEIQALNRASLSEAQLNVTRGVRQPWLARRAVLAGGAVAASAVSWGLLSWQAWQHADHHTGIGERADVDLPDGSVATLNTDTAFNVDFRPDLRLITMLGGEAEFRVRPGHPSPFRVAALGGISDGTGTFALRATAGLTTVTVLEGQTRVASPADPRSGVTTGRGLVLDAGDQTLYASGAAPSPIRRVDVDAVVAWRTGRIIFEAMPFAKAVEDLSRYLPERVVLAVRKFDDVPVSAIFRTRDAFPALEALARTQGLSTHRIPGAVILIS